MCVCVYVGRMGERNIDEESEIKNWASEIVTNMIRAVIFVVFVI